VSSLSFQTLQVLIFLIPGFIAQKIIDTLVVRKEKKEFGKVVEALIFSMIIYTIYSFKSGKSPIMLSKIQDYTVYLYDSNSLICLAALSLAIPTIMAFFITNDLHMKIARMLRITKKTARSSVWFDVFYDIRAHVIINFADGRRIFGWPMYYSNDPEQPYVFLYNPAWIVDDPETKEQKFVHLDEIGILITPKEEIESIEFLKD